MDLNLYPVFIEIMRHGSVSKAAENLEMVHGAEHPDTVKARQLAMTSKSINAKVRRILEGRAAKEEKE